MTADALVSADDRSGFTQLLKALDDPRPRVVGDELRSYTERVFYVYQGSSERTGELRDLVVHGCTS